MRRIAFIGLVALAWQQPRPLLAQWLRGGSFDGAASSVVTCGVAQTFHGGANDGASVATAPCGGVHAFRGSAFDGSNVAVVTCGVAHLFRGSPFDGGGMGVVTCGVPRSIAGGGCNGDHMTIRTCAGEVYVTETCIASIFLPVELIDLGARCETGGVQLWWITGSEMNSAYFNIERAMPEDGSVPTDDLQWRSVGTLTAAGHAMQPTAYSYFDDLGLAADALHGTEAVFHRVVQVDLDGTTIQFPFTVTSYPCDGSQGISLYPVPARDVLHVRSPMPLDAIVISDAPGHVVLAFTSGQDLATLDITRLAPGAYTLAGRHGSGASYARFVVER